MTEEAFIKAILANPEDDAPRLIFADWLDENGQSERATFIRVQCALAHPSHCRCAERAAKWRCRYCTPLRRRERELLGPNRDTWFDCWLPQWTSDVNDAIPGVRYYADVDSDPAIGIAFRRGFVESVTCAAEDWLKYADAILQAQPVREVTLTTPVPIEFSPYVRFLENKLVVRLLFADGDRQEAFNRSDYTPTQMVLSLLGQKWPGIKFTIPEVGEPVFPPPTEEEQRHMEAMLDRWGVRR